MTGHRSRWPLVLIAAPAAVAIWSGWVGLGVLCGFGVVSPLPGIVAWHLNTAITLPIGVEAYGAYALGAWLHPGTPQRARTFAFRSAIGALVYGMCGQVIFHLLAAAGAVRAPWPVVMLVACMPVATLGFGAALTHLLHTPDTGQDTVKTPVPGDDSKPRAAVRAVAPGLVPAPAPAVPRVTGQGQGNRTAILHLRELNPEWTHKEIAAAAGTSAKTVSRHLAHANGDSHV